MKCDLVVNYNVELNWLSPPEDIQQKVLRSEAELRVRAFLYQIKPQITQLIKDKIKDAKLTNVTGLSDSMQIACKKGPNSPKFRTNEKRAFSANAENP